MTYSRKHRRATISKHGKGGVVASETAIPRKSNRNESLLRSALALHQQGKLDEAEALYHEILCSEPRHFDALQLLASVAAQKKNSLEALELFDQVLTINPGHPFILNNRGNALKELKRYEEALASYDKAIVLYPDYADAYNNRGNALKELRRYEDALLCYDRALALKPDNAAVHNNRADVLLEMKRYEEALVSYDKAIELQSDDADAYNNRGNALQELRRNEDALLSYERALELKPDYKFLSGMCLHSRMKMCDWSAFDDQVHQLAEKIERHEQVSLPFPLLALTDSLSLQKKSALIYVQERFPESHALPEIPKLNRHDKIRIGYYSADFCNHPVSFLTAELFELHNRERFELVAFSFGPEKKDEMRERVKVAFDRFIDVRNLSDMEVAELSRSLEIDIAIDLGGFTTDSRTGIFALRAAPIQVSYIGYLGTMGAAYIDYLIADATIVPEESRKHYSEKIVYLPSYQVNDTKRRIADRVFTREECGLPQKGFVFCCFNNNYKITPGTFDGWMRILLQVEGSVLFLYADNDSAAVNLKKEAESRGVEGERLIFGKRLSRPEYLARYRVADLFLDTLPYNAGTTASDALWAGLPVLTCMGESFASRVAASLLNAIRLPELITSTQEEYEALAIELATNPEKLGQICSKLEQNRFTTPLFDTQLFTHHIEEAYREMYERYQADLPPDHLVVEPSIACFKSDSQKNRRGFALKNGKSVVLSQAATGDHASLLQSALTLHQQGRFDEAEALYREILLSQPCHFDAMQLIATIAAQKKNFFEAVALFDEALAINPDHPGVLNNCGNALKELKRYEEALLSYDKAIALNPDYAEAYSNRGVVLKKLRRCEESVLSYNRALGLKPDYAEAYLNRGNALQELKRYEEALLSYDKAIAVKREYAEAYSNRGNALHRLKRFEEALASHDKAIKLQPDYAEAYSNRGLALQGLKRFGEALASYDKALACQPDYAEAYSNRGIALQGLKRFEDALASYDKAIELQTDCYAEPYYNRAVTLQDLRCKEEALASYEQALACQPDYDFLLGHYLHIKMQICDWSAFDDDINQLAEKIEHHENVAPPFAFLALRDSPLLQKNAALIYVQNVCPENHALPELSKREQHGKIRIGYFSADFCNHPVSFLTAELFELHNREQFELFAFSFRPEIHDEMRKRVEVAFDRFIDVQNLSDIDVAQLSRSLEIDIAIDL